MVNFPTEYGIASNTLFSPNAGRITSWYRYSALLTSPIVNPFWRAHLRKGCESGNTEYGAEEPNDEYIRLNTLSNVSSSYSYPACNIQTQEKLQESKYILQNEMHPWSCICLYLHKRVLDTRSPPINIGHFRGISKTWISFCHVCICSLKAFMHALVIGTRQPHWLGCHAIVISEFSFVSYQRSSNINSYTP